MIRETVQLAAEGSGSDAWGQAAAALGAIVVALIAAIAARKREAPGLAGRRAAERAKDDAARPDSAALVQKLASGDGTVTVNLSEALVALAQEMTRSAAVQGALRRDRDKLREWGIHATGDPPRIPPTLESEGI